MKSKLFSLLAMVAVAVTLLTMSPAQAAKVRVVTTLTDLADITRQIGGDHVDVFSLATGIEDTHGIPMKPSANSGANVELKARNSDQKWILPSRSLRLKPVIFGTQ